MSQKADYKMVIEEIDPGDLLTRVMRMKNDHMRLSQACAAYIDDKFELSYSFSDDETYDFTILRLVIDTDTVVPSITDIMEQAVFYENEMKELFGVKIEMISLDYNNKLYRINEEAPFGPKKEEA